MSYSYQVNPCCHTQTCPIHPNLVLQVLRQWELQVGPGQEETEIDHMADPWNDAKYLATVHWDLL